MLVHPLPGAPIVLRTDASNYAVGAVHEQLVWWPLAFFSQQLCPNEQKYSTFNRKLLGLYLAVRHFRFLLEGCPSTMFIDHKPLAFAMSKIAEPWSARQQRHGLSHADRKPSQRLVEVGPLPPSRGFPYLLTMVDRTTRQCWFLLILGGRMWRLGTKNET
ncbi:hypothetical protein AAFF_G00193540 [Aldrovandia affinis]|uniref:Reverse transcriptase RNase H-like domain-containing protein n=1 Tax=Aldrovandia affinis TaxID=143900 RepID=A0AAD7SXB8_9TELE|nr:hypothetical protein AAFF_G00193540 [Aldrovandia affinis]